MTVPDSAVMLTGGLGYSYNVTSTLPLTQTNLADYPVTAATATTGLTAGHAQQDRRPDRRSRRTSRWWRPATPAAGRSSKMRAATTATRNSARSPPKPSTRGQRNDGTTCSWCHTPNRTSSGWSADSTYFVHAIHAAKKRTKRYTWHSNSLPEPFSKVDVSGHPEGLRSNAIRLTATTLAPPRRRRPTGCTGPWRRARSRLPRLPLSRVAYSPYITQDVDYGAGFSFTRPPARPRRGRHDAGDLADRGGLLRLPRCRRHDGTKM